MRSETGRVMLTGWGCKGVRDRRLPVRWPLIILSWLLKSWRYFRRDDEGTAQSAGGGAAGALKSVGGERQREERWLEE